MDLFTVNALDPDGHIIVGSAQFIDANGNPVTLSLTVTNTQAGGNNIFTLIDDWEPR